MNINLSKVEIEKVIISMEIALKIGLEIDLDLLKKLYGFLKIIEDVENLNENRPLRNTRPPKTLHKTKL